MEREEDVMDIEVQTNIVFTSLRKPMPLVVNADRLLASLAAEQAYWDARRQHAIGAGGSVCAGRLIGRTSEPFRRSRNRVKRRLLRWLL